MRKPIEFGNNLTQVGSGPISNWCPREFYSMARGETDVEISSATSGILPLAA